MARARTGRDGVCPAFLSAATAVGIGELLAGLSVGIRPGRRRRHRGGPIAGLAEGLRISTFGTADKTALTLGTVILAAAIGWLAGSVSGAAGHRWVLCTGFWRTGAWAASA
jgi:hypothetical protein